MSIPAGDDTASAADTFLALKSGINNGITLLTILLVKKANSMHSESFLCSLLGKLGTRKIPFKESHNFVRNSFPVQNVTKSLKVSLITYDLMKADIELFINGIDFYVQMTIRYRI